MRLFNFFIYFMVMMLYTVPLWAHGVVGKRFFPASLVVDDPLPADEMTLVAPSYTKGHDEKELSLGFGLQKLLTPNIALSIEGEYLSVNPNQGNREKGFSNPEIGLTYALIRSPEREFIASTAMSYEPGGVGSSSVAEELSRIVPAFLFGKGLGDLPDHLSYLRPLAFTGRVGLSVPIGKSDHHAEESDSTPEYGLVIEYSIPYLQSFVKDVGIPRPFSTMFPIIEFTYGGHHADKGAGFLHPGIIWAGKYVELGIEANIPVHNKSGEDVGVTGLIHLFLDDIIGLSQR
ncbi:MAG: hypothetical protein HY037_07245 [Nitrospirae bacterium]|nr:hypothetical protein [Candidatus Troglogloeales bacterium]